MGDVIDELDVLGNVLGGQPAAGMWRNYHKTVAVPSPELLQLNGDPLMTVADYFTDLCGKAKAILAQAVADSSHVCPLGAAWSLSDIVRPTDALLETMRGNGVVGANRVFRMSAAEVHPGSPTPPERLVLAAGGTSIAELNVFLDPKDLSLRTSGASNGQSMAGAIATGVHGSVIGEGGMQNHVRGILLVTAPDRSVWIERANTPALADAFAGQLADIIVRDDEVFEAVVVHLGAMGIVAGVLLDVREKFVLQIVQVREGIGRSAILELQNGQFEAFANRFGARGEPYFIQVILNPFMPVDPSDPIEELSLGSHAMTKKLMGALAGIRHDALIRLFFPADVNEVVVPPAEAPELIGEPVNLISALLDEIPDPFGMGLMHHIVVDMLMYDSDLFKVFPKPGEPPVFMRWSQTTPPHVDHGKQFSASISFRRSQLLRVLQIMLPAFRAAGGAPFVMTLRFVAESKGLLAFTPEPDTCVIDCDGLMTNASKKAFKAIVAALKIAPGVQFREHFGKLGVIDRARIINDFGDPNVAGTRAQRWRAVREQLLPANVRSLIGSQILRDAGLI